MKMNSLPNYEITRVIGSGCFGYVFEAIDKNHNRKVALKSPILGLFLLHFLFKCFIIEIGN